MRRSHEAFTVEMKAYNSIINNKNRYGKYHKCVFHIHTPASHDFKLLSDKDEKWYKSLKDQDIYNICIENGIFSKDVPIETFNDEKFKRFLDIKDALAYLLLADKLIKEEITLAVVSDHNTSAGYRKLKKAIEILCETKKVEIYPEVILGIEFSCADKIHVVGIFDASDKLIKKINAWITENTLSEKEGTFRTSFDVINKILEWDGIPYIAHMDTSDIFKENYLSGAYKKKLFEINEFNLIGVSDLSQLDNIKRRLERITTKEFRYLIDCDSHSMEELESKSVWIKGSKRNYYMVKEAIRDYDISIKLDKPVEKSQYIKGIYIYNNDGFLSSKDNEEFCLSFSDSLNCTIGGRGTGKSTILQILEFALRQTCNNERELEFICKHTWIWILYYYKGEEYLIYLNLPIKEKDESILQHFRKDNSYKHGRRYYFNKEEISNYTRKNFLEIYKIEINQGLMKLQADSSQKDLLESFFDTKYSVNELVQTASSQEINQFIYNKMFENRTLESPNKIVKIKKASGLRKLLNDVETIMDKRKKEVHQVIDSFNKTQDKILRILYNQAANFEPIEFEELFKNDVKMKSKYYNKMNILSQDVIGYLYALESKIGIKNLLRLTFSKDYKNINKEVPINDFLQSKTIELVEKEIIFIDSNQEELIEMIVKNLIEDENITNIISYLKQYVIGKEEFTLEFNINSKESTSNNSVMYKDVRDLSLGQKVVAMLSFILAYSEYSGDFRPLIIDQPEDNLDNQYIYKNLVKQLRDIKEKRQIIIATHNATIVTNSKAEQVIIMESNNKNGWVSMTGYPTEKRIKKHIINYLEGGIDSFKHKCQIYEYIITR